MRHDAPAAVGDQHLTAVADLGVRDQCLQALRREGQGECHALAVVALHGDGDGQIRLLDACTEKQTAVLHGVGLKRAACEPL